MKSNYDKVIDAIPFWKPTRDCRVFGVSAIQGITNCGLLEAVRLKEKLEYEGAIPKDRY